MNGSTRNFLIFIALLSLLFVLGDIFLWINISNEYNNPEYLKTAYENKYPSSMRNIRGLSILPLILLAFASLVLIRATKHSFFKTLAAVLAAILAIIIIWKMFTLV